MVKVTRYCTWGGRGQGYILTPEQFSRLVTEDAAVVLGLSSRVAQRFAETAGHVVQINDRFSLGAHIRYSLERVA
jgi:hypothetical protein